jgi:hypothetical protein
MLGVMAWKAGAVVLLLLAGCGGKEPTSPASPTPPDADVVSLDVRQGNSFEVEYVSAQPAPGSSVVGYPAVASFLSDFRARLVVRNPSAIDASGCRAWLILQKDRGQCGQAMTAAAFDLPHGEQLEVEIATPDPLFNSVNGCATPVDIASMVATTKCTTGPEAQWGFSGWFGGAQRTWSIHYRVLP